MNIRRRQPNFHMPSTPPGSRLQFLSSRAELAPLPSATHRFTVGYFQPSLQDFLETSEL